MHRRSAKSRTLRQFNKRTTWILAAASMAGPYLQSASAVTATWNDPTAVSVSITAPGAGNVFTSSVALKDGDAIRVLASGTATGALNPQSYYYVVGTGNVPSTTIRLAANPGGVLIAAQAANTAALATQQTLGWNSNPAYWTGGTPSGAGDTAILNASVNTLGMLIDKDTTIGSIVFNSNDSSVGIVSTVKFRTGNWTTLNFDNGAGTASIINNSTNGRIVTLGDNTAYVANSQPGGANNGSLKIKATNGLHLDASAGFTTGATNSSAIRISRGMDWTDFQGDLTLDGGALVMTGRNFQGGEQGLPVRNNIVIGTGAAIAQLQLFSNNRDQYIRGLSGNSNGQVLTGSAASGFALRMGSFSSASDSYTFAGNIGASQANIFIDGSSAAIGTNSTNGRIVKVGASTQVLTGSNGYVGSTKIIGGVLSLANTGLVNVGAATPQDLFARDGELAMSNSAAGARVQSFANLNLFNASGGTAITNTSSGQNTLTLGTTSGNAQFAFTGSAIRNNAGLVPTGAMILFRGTNLGQSAVGTAGATNITFAAMAAAAGIGTPQAAVFKGALADTSATGNGQTFAIYDANGFRPLAAAEQTAVYPGASNTDNVKLTAGGAITGVTTQTLEINNTTGSPFTVTTSGTALNATSGFLFSGTTAMTLAPAAAGNGITGTAGTNGEDVVIWNTVTDPAGVTISANITNAGAGTTGAVAFGGSGNYTITGTVAPGSATGNGGFIANTNGTINLNAAAAFTARLDVNRGTLKLGVNNAFSTKPLTVISGDGKLDLNGNNVQLDSLQFQAINGENTLNYSGGTIDNTGAAADLALLGNTTNTNFYGTITGNVNLVVGRSGTNAQTLSNAHSYTGSTTITSSSATAGSTGGLVIGRFASLPSTTDVTLGGLVPATSGGAGNAGNFGTLTIGDGQGAAFTTVRSINTAGTGAAASNSIVGGSSQVSVLTVNNTAADTFGGTLGSTGGGNAVNLALVKSGSGTLTLSAAKNYYAGGTTINAGTLSISNDDQLGQLFVGSNILPSAGGLGLPQGTGYVTNQVVLDGGALQVTSSMTLNAARGVGIGKTSGATAGTGTIDTSGAGTTLSYSGVIASAGTTGQTNLTKTGAGSLVLGGTNTYSGATTVNNGSLTITGTYAPAVPANASLVVTSPGTVTVSSTGAATYNSVNVATPLTINGTVNVNGTGASSVKSFTGTGTLNITNGTVAIATQSPTPISSVSDITGLGISAGGVLDIKNNAVQLHSTDTTDAARDARWAQVLTGMNNFDNNGQITWDGPGIVSSSAHTANLGIGVDAYTIGVISNHDLAKLAADGGAALPYDPSNPWLGTVSSIGADDVLIRMTYAGDTNLDGQITIDDYNNIDGTFNGTLPTNYGWVSGDFDFNGVITIDDYNAIDAGFLYQGGQLTQGMIAQRTAMFGAEYVTHLEAMAAAFATVPEPTTVGLLGVGAIGLLARRRRKA